MKNFIIFLAFILIISTSYCIYDRMTHLNIIVKFDDLEPFERQMNVYLKGFRIGKTTKVYPDKTFQNTFVILKVNSKITNLPKNISAKVIKGKIGGYVNILFPESPTIERIKNNDEIIGKRTKDFDSFINERYVDEELENIMDNATNVIENANIAIKNLSNIFNEINIILQENHPQINKAVNNLTDTTTSLKEMTNKLNTGVNKEDIKKSLKNVEEMTNQINNETIPRINNILCEANKTTKNVEEITKGIKTTLKEKRGLAKLLFGQPLKN